MNHFCYLCLVFVVFSCLFVVDLWPPAGKRADVCDVLLCFCYFPIWCAGSGMVLNCMDS